MTTVGELRARDAARVPVPFWARMTVAVVLAELVLHLLFLF